MLVPAMKALVSQIFGIAFLLLCLFDHRACDIPSVRGYGNFSYATWTVNSSEEISTLSPKGCNFIGGSVYIRSNYSGEFILDGVQVITGGITIEGSLFDPSANITAISMPDLLYLGSFLARDVASQLTSISMPSLENITDLDLELSGPAKLNFTSLTYATNVLLMGPIDSMDFDSLTNVAGSLEISSGTSCLSPSDLCFNASTVVPPLAIRLPSLVNATGIDFSGNLSGLYMPTLAIANNGHIGRQRIGIAVETYGNPIDISFPNLDTLTDAILAGTMRIISFPHLQNLPGQLSIEAATPMNLDLSILNATSIIIRGNLTGVALPALGNITTLEIYSSLPLDCSFMQHVFQSIRHSLVGYGCYSPPFSSSAKSGNSASLSEGAKVGIGFGAVLAGAVISICSFGVWWRWKRNRDIAKRPPVVEHELQDRNRRNVHNVDDGPPEYGSMAETEFGSVDSEDTVVANVGQASVQRARGNANAAAEERRGAGSGA
ncbi:uncharacterized protein PAC_08069 [Phialocephala subalpina]|uniref:Sporulation-specific protein 2 n=1 Tax=Phialocephala subalpina TaxID=576137 RepID=A0A1L7WZI4_9HELO|nr:uncharacterized protein PAC_08069 [Phialocephala subalpina]